MAETNDTKKFADEMGRFSDDVAIVSGFPAPVIKEPELKTLVEPKEPHPNSAYLEAMDKYKGAFTKDIGDRFYMEQRKKYEDAIKKYNRQRQAQKAVMARFEKRKAKIMEDYHKKLSEYLKSHPEKYLYADTHGGITIMTDADNPGYKIQYYDVKNPEFHGEYSFQVRAKNGHWYDVPFMPNLDVMREGNSLLTLPEMKERAQQLSAKADDLNLDVALRSACISRAAKLQAEIQRQEDFAKQATETLDKDLSKEAKNRKREEKRQSRIAKKQRKAQEKEQKQIEKEKTKLSHENAKILKKQVRAERHSYEFPNKRKNIFQRIWQKVWGKVVQGFKRLFHIKPHMSFRESKEPVEQQKDDEMER